MEQRTGFTAFIQPILHTITKSTSFMEVDDNEGVLYEDFMPLMDVIETIHSAYYFKHTVTIVFETQNSDGFITKHTKHGRIRSVINENNQFAFETSGTNITQFLTLEQVLFVYPN